MKMNLIKIRLIGIVRESFVFVETLFLQRFRISRRSAEFVLNAIRSRIDHRTTKNHALTPKQQPSLLFTFTVTDLNFTASVICMVYMHRLYAVSFEESPLQLFECFSARLSNGQAMLSTEFLWTSSKLLDFQMSQVPLMES